MAKRGSHARHSLPGGCLPGSSSAAPQAWRRPGLLHEHGLSASLGRSWQLRAHADRPQRLHQRRCAQHSPPPASCCSGMPWSRRRSRPVAALWTSWSRRKRCWWTTTATTPAGWAWRTCWARLSGSRRPPLATGSCRRAAPPAQPLERRAAHEACRLQHLHPVSGWVEPFTAAWPAGPRAAGFCPPGAAAAEVSPSPA